MDPVMSSSQQHRARTGVRHTPPGGRPSFREPRLRFQRDHGSHPDFRTEWWYLTGGEILVIVNSQRFLR